MVMETPSPQCVGREFVRQYYTMLHEAPLHLHRFYSNNSSFVHGGVEKPGEEQPPVMGQNDIHKKIISLNFRDCHAKIRQVDSQATVGSAVVVQVTGELSNAGQPMRRFMQTFVLAPQSPKKYYVHNDIFRYQDEVFHDNDTDVENAEETVDSEPETTEATVPIENVQDPTVSSYYDQGPPMSNGNVHMGERAESPSQKSVEEIEKVEEEEPEEEEPVQKSTFEPPVEPKPTREVMETEPETEPEVSKREPAKPFSWADMASKNTANIGGTVPPATQVKQPPPMSQMGGDMKPPVDMGGPAPQPQRAPRAARERGPPVPRERDGSRGATAPGDGEDAGRRSRYPDSHQVFVGNLPHHIGEKDLKQFFEQYGKVVELRINKKSNTSSVPNFGFVVFEDDDTVQKVLSSKPFMFKGEHRLNVEEKKQRGDSGRPGSGTRSMGRGGMGMPRGGGMGGGMGRGGGPRGGGPGMGGGRGGGGRGGGGGGGTYNNTRR